MRPRRSAPPHLPHTLRPGLQALFDLPDLPRRRTPRATLFWRCVVLAIALVALLVWPVYVAWADTSAAADAPPSGSRLGLGMAAPSIQKPYRGVDPERVTRPLLVYESKWWSVYGPSLGLNLPPLGPVAFSLTTRKNRLWLGGSGKWRTGIADTALQWMHDVSTAAGSESARPSSAFSTSACSS